MKHAREDYNDITTNGTTRKIPAYEPVFLLRAQDKFAAPAVRYWAALVEVQGADPAMVEAARAHARLMDLWPVKKTPDLPRDTINTDDEPRYHPDHIDDNRNSAPTAAQAIHPSPDEFTEAELAVDPILRFFHYKHLPPVLQVNSAPFCQMARGLIDRLPRNAERTVALRKLLEAKDCAVRAALPA